MISATEQVKSLLHTTNLNRTQQLAEEEGQKNIQQQEIETLQQQNDILSEKIE